MTCKKFSYTDRAFTLVELMAVVAIVGILAVVAIVGFRKYVNSAKSSEAVQVIGSIKTAEEAYRAETLQYLNVSTNLKTYFPNPNPTNKKTGWGAGSNQANWLTLNVSVDGPVYFGYAVVAGGPGQAVPAGDLEIKKAPTFPNPLEPWYVVQAKGDVDGDSQFCIAVGNSFTSEIYVEDQ
jgi:type IV pilus assembly protein PilA